MEAREIQKRLEILFHPQAVAVIGASNNLTKWGYIVSADILNGGYQGRFYPINPKEETIMGCPAYPRISAVPDEVDVAVIATPAATVPEVIEDCGRKGVKAVVVLTSDFSETGAAGRILEEKIVAQARDYGMILVGPNSMGIVSTPSRLNAMMAPFHPPAGPISIASQSGNFGSMIITWGMQQSLGFNKFVSSGNEGDLTITDYLEYFGEDEGTKVVLLYLEGVDDGDRFIEVARRVTAQKPVIAFKGGKSRAGGRAAASHTGALSGSPRIYDAMFKQCGIIQAQNTQEIVDFAYGFVACPFLPQGRRIGLLTRGGGWGVISADVCENSGLEVPPLPPTLIARLDELLPSFWNRGNPVDMVTTLKLSAFGDGLKLLLNDDSFDAVIGLGIAVKSISSSQPPSSAADSSRMDVEQMRAIEKLVTDAGINQVRDLLLEMRRVQKPLLFVGLSAEMEAIEGIPIFIYPNPERAISTLKAMIQYAEYRRSLNKR